MSIAENVKLVKENIAAAAIRCGRDPKEIKLVAATKMNDASRVREAIAAGVDICGENRVQELQEKLAQGAYDGSPLHFIGHLQTNKGKDAVGRFYLIHSVDSVKLAKTISNEAGKKGIVQKILLQVNNAHEEQKFGFEPEELYASMRELMQLPNLQILGLMNIAPLSQDEDYLRNLFKNIKHFKDRLELEFGVQLPMLSMGMSNDWQIAVEEGSTIIRLGRILFENKI